jgi:hypothetical protein
MKEARQLMGGMSRPASAAHETLFEEKLKGTAAGKDSCH